MLAYESIAPEEGAAKAAVIWLHGIGADGHDFVPIVPHLKLPADLGIRFIFPHAPVRAVSCFGGETMRAWYDILELSEIRKINEQHLLEISQQIDQLIDQQIEAGIPSERIIVIGFSQGGAVALHSALHYPKKLAGLIALSTYLGIYDLDASQLSPANRAINIKIAHGRTDTTVTEKNARRTYEKLRELEYSASWQSYAMGHEVCISEIRDIGRWISSLLQNPPF